MSKGFILKVLEAAQAQGSDLSDEIDLAKDMLQRGYDANDEQWSALNRKVGGLEQKHAAQPASNANVAQGTRGNQEYVSTAQPGEVGNPIGYPGTDQDQDGPAHKNRTVPGVKPPKDSKDKK